MPQNFIECNREQAFLMPPSLRDWLPADHLAWFVIESVARLDVEAFYADYRADGHGRAAYEPSVMVSLVLYAYATNVRSSRAIERHCRQDVAYRVITGNRVPDHATIRPCAAVRSRWLGYSHRCLSWAGRRGWWTPGLWWSMAPSCRATRTASAM